MTHASNRIRVLLADDHPVVLDGLDRFLSQIGDLEIIGTAGSGPEALSAVDALKPDVVVVDLDMPGMRGLPTIEEWLKARPDLRIVVFSMHEEDHLALNLLRAGVFGYLNKSRDPLDLAEAIRYAHRGRRYMTPELTERMLMAGVGEKLYHEAFSPRERQVFDMLVEGLETRTIARRLEISPSTVHTYTDRIKSKLDVGSLAELIRYAHTNGLLTQTSAKPGAR